MREYKIVTFWSQKDNAFVGVCPEFEGLAIVGKSRAAVTKDVEAAIQDYIEIYQEDGIPLPKPVRDLEYSGQVRLRMSRYVHQKAAELAEQEGVSLNSFLAGAVETRIGVREYHDRLLEEISGRIGTATINHINSQVLVAANNYFGSDATRLVLAGSVLTQTTGE